MTEVSLSSSAGETVLRRVCEAVATICRVPLAQLTASTRPEDVKGWDSLGRLQVVMALERVIGAELPLKQAFDAPSIGDLARIVAAQHT